jgi:hypothetical protein
MKRLFALLLILSACQQDQTTLDQEALLRELSAEQYIIFGHYYGMCIGESCIEEFKITPNNLFENIHDVYPVGADAVKEYVLLSDELFEKVKNLKTKVPAELLTSSETVIGIPDGADWGGLYFEISTADFKGHWYIDKNRTYLPEYIVPFVEELEHKITLINN